MSEPVITIELSAEGKAFAQRLEQMPFKFQRAIVAGLDKGAELALGRVREERLTGLGPFPVAEHRLGQVSGQLRQSSYRTAARMQGGVAEARIGSPLRYARVHEFGFNGQVHVDAFTRHVKRGDLYAKERRISAKTGRAYTAKVRVASGVEFVKAHTRWLQMPARAPFGHGLADSAETIRTQLAAAMKAELEGQQP